MVSDVDRTAFGEAVAEDRNEDRHERRRDRRPAARTVRRIVFVGVIALQVVFVARAYWAPHREFGYQMFPESSQWSAEIYRVSARGAEPDGARASIEDGWFGYDWNELVDGRGLDVPWRRHHADSGLDRQLEFVQEALDWVARNTPDDDETRYLEAVVTTWPNLGDAETVVLRSVDRDVPAEGADP